MTIHQLKNHLAFMSRQSARCGPNIAPAPQEQTRSRRCARKGRQFIAEHLESRTLLSGWNTVDNWQLVPGSMTEDRATGMAADAGGNVYAAGVAVASDGTPHGIIREETHGVWTIVADVANVCFDSVTTDSAGDVFATGCTNPSLSGSIPVGTSSGNWIMAERAAGKTSFTIVNDPGSQILSFAAAAGIAADQAGNVFVVGTTEELTQGFPATHWLVRKETVAQLLAGQDAFKTVDDYVLSNIWNRAYGATNIPSGPAAGLYVVGRGNYDWIVRKSTNAGLTWTTVDDFTATQSVFVAYGVAGDESGNVYVVGSTGSDGAWLVRKSSDGGMSWSMSDDFQTPEASDAYGAGIDPAGNVYVVGRVFSNQETTADGIVRELPAGGSSWSTVDDQNKSFDQSFDDAFAVDSLGNAYAGGGNASNANWSWMVRSTASAATTTLTAFGTTLTGTASQPINAVIGSFTDSSSKAKLSNYSASINWGDGGASNGSISFNAGTNRYDVSASHTYAAAGTYTISIIINVTAGTGTAITSTADIAPPGPSPQITGTASTNEGSKYAIQLAGNDNIGQLIRTWSIDWGDGVIQQLSGSTTSASHIYDDGPATALIAATATDAKGFSGSTSVVVMVQDAAPTGVLSASSAGASGAAGSVSFTSAFDPSVADTVAGFRYSFDFDDDGSFEVINSLVPTAPIPANYLLAPGPHVIVGRIADKDGFFTDYTATVQGGSVGGGVAALSAASRIAAGMFWSSLPVQRSPGGDVLLSAGDWVEYRVDFGSRGVKQAKMQLASVTANRGIAVQLRLDNPTGEVLASFSSRAASGHGQTSRSRNVTGVHDIYLEVIRGEAQVNWFSFIPIVAKHKHGHTK